MTDNERDAIKKIMPWMKILISVFKPIEHFGVILQFGRDEFERCKKNCLKYIEKISYPRNKTEYDGRHRQFIAMAPADVLIKRKFARIVRLFVLSSVGEGHIHFLCVGLACMC